MTYYRHITAETSPPTRKLHQYWVAEPFKKGKYMNYWGYSKDEAKQKAKLNNPNANVILWKKEL